MGKPKIGYDTRRLSLDMADRGWMATDLARLAGLSDMTVSRFLRGDRQTARTAQKLANALGYSPRRYVVRVSADQAISA
jgi:transcriptional regulator with XRE-family HTH domain